MHISDEQLDTYRRQGFLIVENFLTEEERRAALGGFFSLYAPSYQDYVAAGGRIAPRGRGCFPGITQVSTTSPSTRTSFPPPNASSARARSGSTKGTSG